MMANKKILLGVLAVVAIVALALSAKELKKTNEPAEQGKNEEETSQQEIKEYSFSGTVSTWESWGMKVRVAYQQVGEEGVAKVAYRDINVRIEPTTTFTRQTITGETAGLVTAKRTDVKVGSSVVVFTNVNQSLVSEVTATNVSLAR